MASVQTEDRSVTCKYLNYKYPRGGSYVFIKLPLVHVRIKSSQTETDTIALMDTGAMSTMIQREMGDVLELDYKKGQDGNLIKIDAEGAGSKFNCLVAKIERLMLIKNMTSFCIYSGIDILVPENNGVLPYMIIGRDYVFPRYDVTFHERRQKITFTKG